MSSKPCILCAKFTYVTIIIILLQTFFNVVNSVSISNNDEVKNLPGQPAVNFKQFAGYISVDEAKQRFLFYYFVEAELNSSSKPLVLWLNGGHFSICLFKLTFFNLSAKCFINFFFIAGPGCSSVGEGAFVEHGPFKPSGRVLLKNQYSWNKGIFIHSICINYFILFLGY